MKKFSVQFIHANHTLKVSLGDKSVELPSTLTPYETLKLLEERWGEFKPDPVEEKGPAQVIHDRPTTIKPPKKDY